MERKNLTENQVKYWHSRILNYCHKITERNESSCILKFMYGPFPIRRVINESSTRNIYIYIGWRTCNQKWWIIFGCGPNPDCHAITSDPLCRTQFSSDTMTLLAKDPMQPGDNKFQQSTIFFFFCFRMKNSYIQSIKS